MVGPEVLEQFGDTPPGEIDQHGRDGDEQPNQYQRLHDIRKQHWLASIRYYRDESVVNILQEPCLWSDNEKSTS